MVNSLEGISVLYSIHCFYCRVAILARHLRRPRSYMLTHFRFLLNKNINNNSIKDICIRKAPRKEHWPVAGRISSLLLGWLSWETKVRRYLHEHDLIFTQDTSSALGGVLYRVESGTTRWKRSTTSLKYDFVLRKYKK